jgi:hypothetical protein
MKSIEHLQMLTNACSRDEDAMRADYAAAVASAKAWDSAGIVSRAQARRVVDTYDPARCRALAQRVKQNGTWMVPTLTVLRSVAYLDDSTLAADARMAYVRASSRPRGTRRTTSASRCSPRRTGRCARRSTPSSGRS